MSSNLISISDIRSLLERGRPLNIVDVRTPAEFAHVHVLGARLMPLDELDPAAVAAKRPSAADPIYVICQSGGRASKACQRLLEAGVTPVYSIEGGTAAWEKMGLPTERGGGNVISLERQVRIGAGLLVLIGSMLAWTANSGFLAIPIFVGSGLVFAGITNYCGMALVLGRMPWNR
jgi:rhodanese-related sulfurtransferase